MKFFGKKSENFKLGKVWKYEERLKFEKKRFHFFTSLLHKNGKVDKIQVLDDRLCFISTQNNAVCFLQTEETKMR